jgi:hypothetical protein
MNRLVVVGTWCKPPADTMLAPTETIIPPSRKAQLYLDAPVLNGSLAVASPGQRVFRRHKVLPHPRNTRAADALPQRPVHRLSAYATASPKTGPQQTSPRSLKHESRRLSGPDLPPTPPTHSRTSSSTHSIDPSSPIYVESPEQSTSNVSAIPPTTPPNQKSPPTPDVTPPQPGRKLQDVRRPVLTDRIPSKSTTASRTESFTTALETPYVSEEDDKATPRPRSPVPAERISDTTVRGIKHDKQIDPQNAESERKLESNATLTPTTKSEFFKFDGDWSGSEVEQEWDDNLNRNVIVRKRRAQPREVANGQEDGTHESAEDGTATPIKIIKPLHEGMHWRPSVQESATRDKRWAASSSSEISTNTDVRRFSGMSTKSTVSTVVEAILVDAPPQQHKTLRHVRKQVALRGSVSEIGQSPPGSAATSVRRADVAKRPRPRGSTDRSRTESYASNSTVNSLVSHKARREVWQNGAIPVVVIPDRSASLSSKQAPSLRSNSSRRSRRSNSMTSVPMSELSQTKDLTPYFDRPPRRGRATSRRGRGASESDQSPPAELEQMTVDYPPIVPMRSSSISAPTSKNASAQNSRQGSRAGSLTAESLRAHDALQEQQTSRMHSTIALELAPSAGHTLGDGSPSRHDREQSLPDQSVESHRGGPDQRSLVDHKEDPVLDKRLTTHHTPFSQASVETNGTRGTHGTHGTHSAAEVSEAMAVNIYAHQNKSVLMVDHTSRGTESNGLPTEQGAEALETGNRLPLDRPRITTTNPDGEPVTPPHSKFPLEDVESPLRNPRPPPKPPAIEFTPATPSGTTPAAEKMKMLGNYFEEVPGKRPSLVKRALSLHRNLENAHSRTPSLLSRTLSRARNSRNIRKDTAENPDLEDRRAQPYTTTAEDQLQDEGRLHPHWRPASSHMDPESDEDCVYDVPDEVDEAHRPSPRRRRSLSQRMKHTFAILPITDDEHYMVSDSRGPERRTIRRTPSGSLRVMKHRDSQSSLRWRNRPSRRTDDDDDNDDVILRRPSSVPDGPGRWVYGADRPVDSQGRRFFPGWQDKMEQYGLHNLQRRMSERKRQKRSDALRQMISGPREVRDGVGEVIKRRSYKGPSYQSGTAVGR